jgi:hypothetical protein
VGLARWAAFVASDTGLQVARVCRFYGINPAYWLEDETDDRFEQLAVAEALMLRLQVFEKEQQDAAEDEAKRNSHVQQSLAQPGIQPRVSPPSVDEVKAMMKGG